ncbi:MAG: UDP-N-acetylglucosamine 2-epimerase (non-hydrolyzing) [Parvicellaceae bacterium]|jgi:UDP-N-acetylglucosamine 2-epimerase (non-hydrolysing)
MNKTLLIFGTRPELIKVAPIIHEYERRSIRDSLLIIHSNQHNTLLEQDLIDFNIKPDYQVDLDRKGPDLSELVGSLLLEFNGLLSKLIQNSINIDSIISQGDTATTYCSALIAFHSKIPFYHIEAGLRTNDILDPFPEEFYRKSISVMASFHFTPSQLAYKNLINEGVDSKMILNTGNTVIDNLEKYYSKEKPIKKREALITLHRRTSKQSNRVKYLEYFKSLADNNKSWKFKWLNHPGAEFKSNEFEKHENIQVMKPVSLRQFLQLYEETSIVYTDSGGIQEEAAYLGIPCVVARGKTERIEGINCGVSSLLDINVLNVSNQLEKFDQNKLTFKNELYGDGKSAERIVTKILELKKLLPVE